MSTILWFQNDLRLADNPAISMALRCRKPVVPVYVLPPKDGASSPTSASDWWLCHSLHSLDLSLRRRGSRLIVVRGCAPEVLEKVAVATSSSHLCFNASYDPDGLTTQASVRTAMRRLGIECLSTNGTLLNPPDEIFNSSGHPYQVFTSFWKACQAHTKIQPETAAPEEIPAPSSWPDSLGMGELNLLPSFDWAAGLRSEWRPGEPGAINRLSQFLSTSVGGYSENRDFPSIEGVSRLSPHLHFGEISPQQVYRAVSDQCANGGQSAGQAFLRQVAWREFAHYLLYHFPHTVHSPLRPEYSKFPWRNDKTALRAWQKGRTGYPLVDAGMRQLWHSGWMHNRVRMVTASFLVKDLLIHWQHGVNWFANTLVDADVANNVLGWQWVAGCGADAAPYFRIFNPVTQGTRFDPTGDYVRRWVPEIANLPDEYIHTPWMAPAGVLSAARVSLGSTYPFPIVDHSFARQRALDALSHISHSRLRSA